MSDSLTGEASPRDMILVLAFLVLPVLTYFGSMLNAANNNSLLLMMIFLVAVVAFAISLPGDLIPQKFYPLAIITISFCLLFHVQWISPYLVGYGDDTVEYFIFEAVRSSGHWSPAIPELYNSALSVTILPTMVQSILAVDDTTIFKTLYPLAFSLVPAVLYLAYRDVVGSKRAFVSSLFFMSYTAYFLEVSFIGKQEIAEIILASLILLTFRGRSEPKHSGRAIAMMVLIAGLIASHYSLSYVYISFLLLSWLAMAALKKRSVITLSFVALSAVLALGWYIFTAGGSVFFALVQFANSVFGTMISELFNPTSRGSTVLKFFGVGIRTSIVNTIDLLVQYSIQLFIIVGVIGLWKQRKVVNLEFISYASIALFLLVSSIVIPNFAQRLNVTRIYQIALIFLSPACVLGGESLFKRLFQLLSVLTTGSWHARLSNSDRNLRFAASIIILFLLFNTGFVNEIAGAAPSTFSLGFNRIRESNDPQLLEYLYSTYIPEQDFMSTRWLYAYMVRSSSVCGDYTSGTQVLLAYSGIPLQQGGLLKEGGANITLLYPGSTASCGYIYLRYQNVIYGTGDASQYHVPYLWHMSGITDLVNDRNVIYSNGGSNVLS
jgi:uncharacterized membrane protein